jgi:hypothetical protein
VITYAFDPATGAIAEHAQTPAATGVGGAARHLAVHPGENGYAGRGVVVLQATAFH